MKLISSLVVASLISTIVLFATLQPTAGAEDTTRHRRHLAKPVCGDGIRAGPEDCDDGNTDDGDGCSSTCKFEVPATVCGNGSQEGTEECDDGNTDSGDGCSSTCKIEGMCGNGVVDAGEDCDGTLSGICTVDEYCDACTCSPLCGNSIVDGGEDCDGTSGSCTSDQYCDVACTCQTQTQAEMSIFGVWHCGNHYCDWSVERSGFVQGLGAPTAANEFDYANRWMVDRHMDGTYEPSVNLVILSFLEPEKFINELTNEGWLNGVPRGMTVEVVNYFKDRDIKVMVSVGGVTYADEWDRILEAGKATLLAQKMWKLVQDLGLDGWEIDYENGTPEQVHLDGVEEVIDKYRLLDSYSTILTMDLAVGNRFLTEFSRRASEHNTGWLASGKLNYINAMVPGQEPKESQWQEHIDGMPHYNPPVHGKKPCNIVVSQWLIKGKQPHNNCDNFNGSPMLARSDYVRTVVPNGSGSTPGFLGYMFWAGESTSPSRISTDPSGQTCEGGMGVAAETFNIPVPVDLHGLRQD